MCNVNFFGETNIEIERWNADKVGSDSLIFIKYQKSACSYLEDLSLKVRRWGLDVTLQRTLSYSIRGIVPTLSCNEH